MSTYAQHTNVEAYIEGWITDDRFALERLIRRCERQVDDIVIPVNFELPPTQVIGIPGATGGTFTLSFTTGGVTYITPSLAYNATAAIIQAALQALTPIGLDVTGVSNAGVLGDNPWTVIWNKDWVQSNYSSLPAPAVGLKVPLLTVDTTLITPGGIVATVVEAQGRVINPLVDLDENQVDALARATCAQVEYRNAMGERFFVRPQYQSVRGPDFATVGKLPMLGPKVRSELASGGLLMTGARAIAGMGRRGVARGWPTY